MRKSGSCAGCRESPVTGCRKPAASPGSRSQPAGHVVLPPYGGRSGGRMPDRACADFRPWLARHPTLSNGTGRRATVANDVLGDMKQLVDRYSSGGRPTRV
jgi:hypothetical protein